jgi:ABC-2 type transport system ATP-binding protein
MIEVRNLSKRYRGVTAVDDVSFSCAPGTVTGFLGPNGAGKSTTMRMLCGLTKPDTGSATVLGVPYASLPNPGRRVGVLLDASAQHAGRTGREVLRVSAMTLGSPAGRVDEVLETVGLSGKAAGRRVGGYSLGMRQRLGIAHALLGEPEVLVLDEPANGLDPEGIFQMRSLLRDFADRGGAVLLSSHLLLEVEAVADRFVMIAGGRIVAQGGRTDLESGVVVRGEDPDALEVALSTGGLSATRRGDTFTVAGEAVEVGRAAARAGVVLTELRADGGLERMFLELTGNGGGSSAALMKEVV